jgi:hypothetical protein
MKQPRTLNSDKDDSSDGSLPETRVNRRDFIRHTAALSVTTGAGLGTVGLAAAATTCKDEDSQFEEKDDWWHRKSNSATADNYDCDNISPYYKVEHGASIAYYGSCYWNDSWKHEFHEAGHAEHFTRDYCNSDWAHSHGIREHSISFYNNSQSTTSMPISQNEMVKAAPPVDSYDSPDEYMDYAYTALNAAVGYYSWPLGTAMALAGVYVNNLPNDPDGDDPDVYYDWDYGSRSNAKQCGSHFVKQMVHGNGGGQGDGFDFDCYDEVWGYYPNYTSIHFNFSYDDPYCSDDCSCPSSSSTAGVETNDGGSTSACENRPPSSNAAVEPGDRIYNSQGQRVKVTAVDEVKTELPGTEPTELRPEELPGTLEREIDTDETVLFRRFPMTFTKRRISGEVLD